MGGGGDFGECWFWEMVAVILGRGDWGVGISTIFGGMRSVILGKFDYHFGWGCCVFVGFVV